MAATHDHAPLGGDLGLTDLGRRDYVGVFRRAGSQLMADNMTSVAKGVAYSMFLAIPSALLVLLGALSLTAGPGEIERLVGKLDGVVPASVQALLLSNLRQVTESQGGGLMVAVGLVLAVWSVLGAVQTVIWGLNIAYERREQRGFVRQRVAALTIAVVLTAALAAVFVVLVLAPYMTGWVGDRTGYPGAVGWLWWTLQWPILFAVLLAAFAARAVPRAGRGAPALPVHHAGRGRRGAAVDRRIRAVRGVHRGLRFLQQDLGVAGRGDRDADVALAERGQHPFRGRGERGGRARPRGPRRYAARGNAHRAAPVSDVRARRTWLGSRMRSAALQRTGVLAGVVATLLAMVSVQSGAAIAITLFATVGPVAVVALRLVTASAFLVSTARPPAAALRTPMVATLAGYGLVIAGMNCCSTLRSSVCRSASPSRSRWSGRSPWPSSGRAGRRSRRRPPWRRPACWCWRWRTGSTGR